jgi:uncharacterized protein
MMEEYKSYSLDLNITNDCNWRCKYCIEKDHHCNNYMSEDTADKIIEKLDFLLDNNYYNGINLSFWGGEPTLNHTIIKKFIDKYYNDRRCSFSVFTNGSLLKKYFGLIEKVYNYDGNIERFHIQISYDGYPIHEKKRRTKGDTPTAKKTRNLIKTLYDRKYNFNLKSTFSYDDIDILYDSYLDILNLSKELKDCFLVNYSPTLDYSNEFIQLLNNNYDSFKNKIINQLEKICVKEYQELSDKNISNNVFTWLDLSKKSGNLFCGAGSNYHTIDYNGDLYTCHGCLYINNYKDHIFASVYDDNEDFYNKTNNHSKLFEIPDRNDKDENTPCGKCSSILCYKCNAECYDNSKKSDFMDRWYDFENKKMCDLYREISYLIISFKKITMDKLKIIGF